MSADNFYVAYEIPDGRWILSMGFASDDEDTVPVEHDPVFDDELSALHAGDAKYSEYGCSSGGKITWDMVPWLKPAEAEEKV